jgi:hypothetical protein
MPRVYRELGLDAEGVSCGYCAEFALDVYNHMTAYGYKPTIEVLVLNNQRNFRGRENQSYEHVMVVKDGVAYDSYGHGPVGTKRLEWESIVEEAYGESCSFRWVTIGVDTLKIIAERIYDREGKMNKKSMIAKLCSGSRIDGEAWVRSWVESDELEEDEKAKEILESTLPHHEKVEQLRLRVIDILAERGYDDAQIQNVTWDRDTIKIDYGDLEELVTREEELADERAEIDAFERDRIPGSPSTASLLVK